VTSQKCTIKGLNRKTQTTCVDLSRLYKTFLPSGALNKLGNKTLK